MRSLRCSAVVFLCVVSALCLSVQALSAPPRPKTNPTALTALSELYQQRLEARRGPLYVRLLGSVEPPQSTLNEDPNIRLMFVYGGRPFYYQTVNLNAAKTISTNKVWPGGGYGYALTGSGTALGEMCVWDAGGVLTTHQELTGRVTQMDSPAETHFHSTHVAGTMMAGGVTASAKGMSYQANLAAYDWENDLSEMASAATGGMVVSSHSYTAVTGWYFPLFLWYWYGDVDVSPTEDYYFGFYSSVAQDWDQLAYNAPYYTIVIAGGNDRQDAGPGPGGVHYYWDNALEDWVFSMATRERDGGADGYDSMSHMAIAKNVVSAGAVNDIPGGYSSPADVVMTAFSGWGPTDDGRIKPDLVTNGVDLYSSTNTSNTSYASYSGTSMAAPNLSGSLNLLIQQYEDTHGSTTPLASTMKAVMIQTADEAGTNPGPDYRFGWGLLNTLAAADFIAADGSNPFLVLENSLANGDVDTFYLYSDGIDPLRLTLAWTDPPGTPPPPSLNPTTLMLVHDLDMRLEHVSSSTVHFPYVLNPANPANAAATGDNVRDNVEQVHVASPSVGDYRVTISHKGTLSGGQWYSLVSSEPLSTVSPSDEIPPTVSVISPNGGEILVAGTQFEITWIATDAGGVDSVSILYSVNGGATFDHVIATGEPNDSSFTWQVPATPSGTCLVRVIAYDPSLNSGQDESDAVFSIVSTTPLPTFSRWGRLILACLLAVSAVALLMRSRRPAVPTVLQ